MIWHKMKNIVNPKALNRSACHRLVKIWSSLCSYQLICSRSIKGFFWETLVIDDVLNLNEHGSYSLWSHKFTREKCAIDQYGHLLGGGWLKLNWFVRKFSLKSHCIFSVLQSHFSDRLARSAFLTFRFECQLDGVVFWSMVSFDNDGGVDKVLVV